jgi:putative exosortase-associated protein (TIGR04073 family)
MGFLRQGDFTLALFTLLALIQPMKRILALAFLLAAPQIVAHADISMPVRDSFYDKLGRGLSNVIASPSEMLDSQYGMIDTEGNNVAFFKGFLVQGTSRMVMDIGHGLFEIVTSPFPTQNYYSYRSMKMAPYDSMVVNDYPPGDLKNWY